MEQEESPRNDAARMLAETADAAAAPPIRVLPADSRPLLLGAMVQLIELQSPQLRLVGQASSYARALYLAEVQQPDVVLLSLCQDPLDALETVSALKRLCRGKVLVIKSRHDQLPISRLLHMGAARVVIAEDSADVIVQAIFQVHQLDGADQKPWSIRVSARSERASGSLNEGSLAGLTNLTSRERALIKAMVANPGAKYPAIGAQLGITEHTVHNYLGSIYQKLNLANRTDLLVYAVKHGLAGGDDEDPLRERLVN